MLGFGFVFVVASIAFTIVIQNFYERSAVLPRFPWVDPILGGILGVVQGGIIIGAAVMILDSYFRAAGAIVAPTEILFLRDFDHAIDVSETAKIFRQDLIPNFFVIAGALFPDDIRALFPR
jgi:hypothetical protein